MPPRSSTTKRQQAAANQRDTRHENGLVGPGKRVQKQKSNGHINGHAKAAADSTGNYSTSPPPLPSPPRPLAASPPGANGHVRCPQAADTLSEHHKIHAEALRASSDSEMSSAEYNASSVTHESHRQIDVNAAKNPAVHRDVGAMGLAKAVLTSCPLPDTIAILIVLLQLPPTILTLVHCLFALLTYVPASLSSLVNIGDLFEGAFSTPSIPVIVVIDMLVGLIWLFLWAPFQSLALDLAQVVIALTLGGGASGREGGINNVLICFVIIVGSQFARHGQSKQFTLRGLASSVLYRSPDQDDPLEAFSPSRESRRPYGLFHRLIAIHILTQGVVRYIRDWYVRREKRDNSTSGDPEAGTSATETGHESSTTSQTQNGGTPSLLSNHAAITSKKKRKQSQKIRLRQPLWSALASTKIVMVKEYETSHTAAESAGANATDADNLGNAPFDKEPDRLWITYIGSDVVFFSSSYFPNHTPPEDASAPSGSGIDKSKPFFVRLNNSTWQPTRITAVEDAEDSEEGTRWFGEIYGLAASSSYDCEFISTIDGTVFFSSRIQTQFPTTADPAVAVAPNPANGRPGSPSSTIKASIAAADSKLNDDRNRVKQTKKEHRAKLTALRKENDKLNSSLAPSGGSEDRQRQRHQQYLSQLKQNEDAIEELETQIASFEPIPTDQNSKYTTEKKDYQAHRDHFKKERNSFEETKSAAEQEIQSLVHEINILQQKRERLTGRIAKLNVERERIMEANAKGLDEAQRQERKREANEAERAKYELLYTNSLNTMNAEHQKCQAQLRQLQATNEAMQIQLFHQQRQVAAVTSSPTSSMLNVNTAYEYDIPPMPGNFPWHQTAGPSPIYPSAASAPPFVPQNSSPATGPRTRGRSSSMLSNLSGFTEASASRESFVPAQPSLPPNFNLPGTTSGSPMAAYVVPTSSTNHFGGGYHHLNELWRNSTADVDEDDEDAAFYEDADDGQGHGRKGSGSGSGSSGIASGNGSIGDPKSPIVGSGNGSAARVVKW